jgi:hypothetical protein
VFFIKYANLNEGEIAAKFDSLSVRGAMGVRRMLDVRMVHQSLFVFSNDPTPVSVNVWNLLGRRIDRRELLHGAGRIDFKALPKGAYIYRVQKGQNTITEPFILSR